MPRLTYRGVLFYLYEPGLSRLLRGVHLPMSSGLTFLKEWDDEFRSGRTADLYQYAGAWGAEVDAQRFVDLREHIDWKRLRVPTPDTPVYNVPLDFFAHGVTYNVDALAELCLCPPFRAWKDFLAALETCRKAKYRWPIAMPNSETSPWATLWFDRILDRRLRRRYRTVEALHRAVRSGRFRVRDAAYADAAKLIKKLSAYFLWYANTYTSIQTKPFYFNPRPTSLFRPGDFRRMRLDNDRHERGEFPFREGTMALPETDRGIWGVSLTAAVSRHGRVRDALKLVRKLLSPPAQRELARWGNTMPALKSVPPAPAVADIPFGPEPALVTYRGISPDARRQWFRAFQELVEPSGTVPAFLRAVDTCLALDR